MTPVVIELQLYYMYLTLFGSVYLWSGVAPVKVNLNATAHNDILDYGSL